MKIDYALLSMNNFYTEYNNYLSKMYIILRNQLVRFIFNNLIKHLNVVLIYVHRNFDV